MQTGLRGVEQVHDPGFRWVRPLGERYDVDLPTVEALRNDRCLQSARFQPIDGERCCAVELGILLFRCDASRDELWAVITALEHLGSTIDAEEQPPRA